MAGHEYDFVIIGSGAGSVCAALYMQKAGRSALIIEKETYFGGSTALSGGVIWVPNNPVQKEAGVADSREAARAYLDACAGPVSKGSSEARREAFLSDGPEAIAFLRDHGMKLVQAEGYSDYHETEYHGGCARGRAMVPAIFNLNELGEKASLIDTRDVVPPVMTHEVGHVTLYGRTWKSRLVLARLATRLARNWLGQKLVGTGRSLQGRLLQIATRHGLEIWMNSPATGLLTENGAVTGVKVRRDGEEVEVRARLGVLINAGGFSHSQEMRDAYMQQPSQAEWTISNDGDTGEVLKMAMELGADVENLDLCWWVPGPMDPDVRRSVFVFEFARPHAILVDQRGERFTNEATSYVQIGLNIREHNRHAPTVPCWMVFDRRHRERYVLGQAMPGKTPKHWLDSGYLKKADTIEELAALCDLPADRLKATVERFNGFAREGVDHDFRRGVGAYPRYLGDPTSKPNPSLGTIEKAPFYGLQIWPRDVGTCGGLVTDERARVLDTQGRPIPGLYATGNSTSSVHGPSYPGAGASIGASLTFGYAAARHAARSNAETGRDRG
jgi:3-oxosteroid 1-dehydrogenase